MKKYLSLVKNFFTKIKVDPFTWNLLIKNKNFITKKKNYEFLVVQKRVSNFSKKKLKILAPTSPSTKNSGSSSTAD